MELGPQSLPPPPWAQRLRWLLWAAGGAALFALTVAIVAVAVGNRTQVVRVGAGTDLCRPLGAEDAGDAERAGRRLASLRPRGRYVVIDTYRNRLKVYEGETLLREAVCSTGSGTVLVHPDGSRVWTFDTPLGERRVVRKVRDPVWTKPDWAFIEEGFEPPRDFAQRIDRVSLGNYALYLGDGYIIHGTLFQTLLGQGVTHGCVRLGDEDLEYVYQTIPVGARVYLY